MRKQSIQSTTNDLDSTWSRLTRRRKFLQGLGVAAAALPATTLFGADHKRLSRGDTALLQAALTIELIEADLWQQYYNELGGAVDHNDQPNSGNPAYLAALQNLDGDFKLWRALHNLGYVKDRIMRREWRLSEPGRGLQRFLLHII